MPFLFVAAYVLLVLEFYHDEAHWTGLGFGLVLFEIGLTTAAYAVVWFFLAWGAAVSVGVLVPLGVMLLLGRIPIARRHAVVEVPDRVDTAFEVWGRFGLVFAIALGFELLFMIVLFHRGLLSPRIIVEHPELFFFDEGIAGVLLGVLLAPSGPYISARLKLRITDALPFPYLWLALLLLVIGGTTLAVLVVLPGLEREPAVFFLSILLYAPAAWFIALAYSRSEWSAQLRFLDHAWRHRDSHFHVGQLEARDTGSDQTVRV